MSWECCPESKKNKLYGPFLWMGFNCLKATATSRRQFTFYHSVPRNSWCSFYRPRKDERLSRPWSHPVVLNMGLMDWESSALTTRPLHRPRKLGQQLDLRQYLLVETKNSCINIAFFTEFYKCFTLWV